MTNILKNLKVVGHDDFKDFIVDVDSQMGKLLHHNPHEDLQGDRLVTAVLLKYIKELQQQVTKLEDRVHKMENEMVFGNTLIAE